MEGRNLVLDSKHLEPDPGVATKVVVFVWVNRAWIEAVHWNLGYRYRNMALLSVHPNHIAQLNDFPLLGSDIFHLRPTPIPKLVQLLRIT